jgi:hypothetical protein
MRTAQAPSMLRTVLLTGYPLRCSLSAAWRLSTPVAVSCV